MKPILISCPCGSTRVEVTEVFLVKPMVSCSVCGRVVFGHSIPAAIDVWNGGLSQDELRLDSFDRRAVLLAAVASVTVVIAVLVFLWA